MREKQRGGASAGMPVLAGWRWLTLSALMMVACRPAEAPQAAPPSDTVYTIAIVSSTPSDLPKCTASLAGTTAYVQSPVGLFSCISNTWVPLPCTTLLAGAVAYASSSQTLLACVSGQWTKVALPQGAQGVAGPSGAQGAKGERGDAGASSLVVQLPVAAGGTTCPYGGTEIESGLDENGNHMLDSAEVTSISWVCDGATGATGAPATPIHISAEPPGPNCAAGGERIDVGTQTAYVCNGTSAVSTGAGGSPPDPGAGGAAPPPSGSLPPHCAAFPSGVPAAVVTVSGTVVAPATTGATPAVAGALVQALGPDGSSLGTATTDTNGRFSLSLVTGGAPLAAVLRVSKTGFIVAYWNPPAPIVGDTEAAVSLFSPQVIAAIDPAVDLQKSQIVVGVVDCQGHPVAGAQVSATPAPEAIRYLLGISSTGSTGLALLRNATPGNVQVSAVVGGFAFAGPNVSAIAGAVVETTIVTADSQPAICAGAPSGVPADVVTVSGSVFAETTTAQTPAAGAMVEAIGPGGSSLGTATTDADGRFSLSLVTGGAPVAAVLRISKAGFIDTYWNPPAPIAGNWQVGLSLFSSQDFVVDPQKSDIFVTVIDCQSAPVAGAQVRAAPAPENIFYPDGGSSTESTGVAVLLLNATPGEVQLSAVVGGLAFTGPNVTAVAGAVVETTIVVQPPAPPPPPPPPPPPVGSLPPNCAIVSSGVPAAVVTVSGSVVAETTTANTPAAAAMVDAIGPGGSSLGTTTTDAEGRFSLSLVTGGAALDVVLRTSKTGFVDTYWKPPTPIAGNVQIGVSIFESQALLDLDPLHRVDLQKSQVFVVVADCQGQPVAGAQVRAAPASEDVLYANGGMPSTDSSGLALLLNATPGDVQLSAIVGGLAFAGPNVTAIAGAVIETVIIAQP